MQYKLSPSLNLSLLFHPKANKNLIDTCGRGACLFFRGRDALAFIIENIGLENKDEVLLPAFGCPDIIECFLKKGVKVEFYRVDSSLKIDICDIRQRVYPGHTKAVLFINYFGFLQEFQDISKLKDLGLILIEDKTHSLLSRSRNNSCDYTFASLRKLLPVPEGCFLWFINPLVRNSYKKFIKTHQNRTSDLKVSILRTIGLVLSNFYQRHPNQAVKWLTGEVCYRSESMLNQSKIMTHISGVTKRVISNSDVDECFKKRRMNYVILAEKLRDASEITVIKEELMPEECPMGLPVLVKNRKLWQYALKQLGIEALPLWELHPVVNRLHYSEVAKIADEILVFPVSHEYDDRQVKSMADKILSLQKAT